MVCGYFKCTVRDPQPPDQFVDRGNAGSIATQLGQRKDAASYCLTCRDKGMHYDKREERRKAKRAWYCRTREAVAKYRRELRARYKEKDLEGFLRYYSELQAKFRAEHPGYYKKLYYANHASSKLAVMVFHRRKRGVITFLEDTQAAMELMALPCVYCGEESKPGASNGIDCMVVGQGYVRGNVAPACKICNNMKGQCDPSNFICRAKHITGAGSHSSAWPAPMSASSFASYRRRAKKKGLAFALTEDKFNDLRAKPCVYCKLKTGTNGVDRIDNKLGYVKGNVQTCCKECNYMKKDLSDAEFRAHLAKVAACKSNFEFNNDSKMVYFILPAHLRQYGGKQAAGVAQAVGAAKTDTDLEWDEVEALGEEMEMGDDEDLAMVISLNEELRLDEEAEEEFPDDAEEGDGDGGSDGDSVSEDEDEDDGNGSSGDEEGESGDEEGGRGF